MSLIKPITVDYFLNNVADKTEEYLVKIKLKYNHEAAYRYIITTFSYNFTLDTWIIEDDYDEGEEEIFIDDYITFEDVFKDLSFARKSIHLLIDKVEHLNSKVVCSGPEDIPKDIRAFLEKEMRK